MSSANDHEGTILKNQNVPAVVPTKGSEEAKSELPKDRPQMYHFRPG